MPITTSDRYFGEGISYAGLADPADALKTHRQHVRVQRLNDLLGKDTTISNATLATKFEEIESAINAADDQVNKDNASFIKKHKLNQGE